MMMTKKEKKRVPELRFPGFEGEWEKKRLEKLFSEFKSGNNITATQIKEVGKYPVYGGNGLRGYFDEYTHDGNYFLIGRQGALCGNINRSKGRAYFSEHAIACKANDLNDTNWLSYRLEYLNLNRLSESSAQPGLSVRKLLRLKLTVPNLNEQQKIAHFLTSLDTRIQQLEKKKTLLEQYKKGVMQKIFSQEIRFRRDDGEEFGKWEEKRLGEMLDYEQPTKFIVKSTEYDDSFPTPVLTAGKSFILGYTDETENIYTDFPVIIFDDFTMVTQFVDFPFKVKSSAMKILKPSNDKFNIKFIFELIQMIRYPKGDEHKRFWISEYSKIKIGVPCIEEQTKIAHFLSSLDRKIAVTDGQIEKTKEWKKGLLQRMFV